MLPRLAPALRSSLRVSPQPTPSLLRSLASLPQLQRLSNSPAACSSAVPNYRFQTRGAASNVSSQPGSSNVKQAVQNIREEVGTAASEVAKGITGAPREAPDLESVGGSTFSTVTLAGIQAVPNPVLMWGLAGTIPYAVTAGVTAWTARNTSELIASGSTEANLALLNSVQSFQITYGAIILSFLGALHWGMEFAKQGGEQGHKRLALGVAPLLYAWPTLYMADPNLALVAQWTGFLVSWGSDRWATSQGWTPVWYSQYRFYLTAVAGGSILLSLIALDHYDVRSISLVKGHGEKLQEFAAQHTKSLKDTDLKATDVKYSKDQSGSSFGHLDHKPSQEEKDKKKGEDKKLAEKQNAKDEHQMDSSKGIKKEEERNRK